MSEHPFLTSKDCQGQAAECRSLARQSLSFNIALQLSRLAGSWEALAIEIELYSPLEAASVAGYTRSLSCVRFPMIASSFRRIG
jgi:hypothetical protein